MSTQITEDEGEQIILDALKRNKPAEKRMGWPGLPISQLTLHQQSTALPKLLERGAVEIVRRESPYVPGRVLSYVKAC